MKTSNNYWAISLIVLNACCVVLFAVLTISNAIGLQSNNNLAGGIVGLIICSILMILSLVFLAISISVLVSKNHKIKYDINPSDKER